MSTLIDWNALDYKIRSYINQYDDCVNHESAFRHIVIEYVLSLEAEEVIDSLTDGPLDRGIDAVYVDSRDGKNIIHLFQFKFATAFSKSKNNFPSIEIDKFLSFLSDLLDQNKGMKKTCNPLLWGKVQEIWDALTQPNPSFEIHLASNMQPLVPTERVRFENSLAKYRNFRVNEHSIDSIIDLFLERKHPRINAQIQLVDTNYFERTDGNIRGLIATVEANEIIKIIRDTKNPLVVRPEVFNDNVRVYLTMKNQINRKIMASALSEVNSDFWYLNNGITMTCDSFSYQSGQRAPIVSLRNVQIVNGGQTSQALFEAQKESPERVNNVLVLTRIYETKTKEISSKIAESTNSQTPINTRDLRSNDEIQKKLEESFLDLGFYYERKARQHNNQPNNVRVDALAAGQAFLAYHLQLPETAKKERSRVFSDLYEKVFNDSLTPNKLLVPLNILAKIDKIKHNLQNSIRRKEKFDSNMLFIVDGAYHVLFTVAALCKFNEVYMLNEDIALSYVDDAVNIVAKLVKEESTKDPAFSFNRFFKDANTKNKIGAKIQARRKLKAKST